MKKHMYKFGAVALALALGGLPAAALAENGGAGQEGVKVNTEANVQVSAQAPQTTSVTAGVKPSIKGSTEEGSEMSQSPAAEAAQHEGQKAQEGAQHANEQAQEAVKHEAEQAQESVKHAAEQELEMEREGVPFRLEASTSPALSFDELKQSIEQRKQELDQEVASSSPAFKALVEDANPVRLAVHSLLASKDLLTGGIGQQVSEIAKQVNSSVATTTSAEAKIQSRGFLTRLLFGGDSASADVIKEEVAQNQQRIDDLTKLLGQANISADVQATLNTQIAALQDAQARLQDLAQKEQSAWGLFSWRF